MSKMKEKENDNAEVYTFNPNNTQVAKDLNNSLKEGNESVKSINPLRKERIIVRHIYRGSSLFSSPDHIFAGGMADNAVHIFTVPRLSNGSLVNVLTNSEKEFLENAMQLEVGGLSIYKTVNNYWEGVNGRVRLRKEDNYFDLSVPSDYIKYKILLANSDKIAPSMEILESKPKATYEFVITSEKTEVTNGKLKMDATMQCYREFGKIEKNVNILRVIVETLENKPTSPNNKLEWLQLEANKLIQSNSKMFLKVITDPLLTTKVTIKEAIENGIIFKRGNYLYLTEDNSPLCNKDEEPLFHIAAKYLNQPNKQALKLLIESKLEMLKK